MSFTADPAFPDEGLAEDLCLQMSPLCKRAALLAVQPLARQNSEFTHRKAPSAAAWEVESAGAGLSS